MKQELEAKVKNYFEAKRFADEAKAQVDRLGLELKELLFKEGITKERTSNGFDVSPIPQQISAAANALLKQLLLGFE